MSSIRNIVNLPEEKQKRLMQIAAEHLALVQVYRDVKARSDKQHHQTHIFERIETLKAERSAILDAEVEAKACKI